MMDTTSLFESLRAVGLRRPEHVALRFGDRSWNYGELYRQADALAAGLGARQIDRGDRVAFLLPNGPALVLLNLACLALGAIEVPLNNRLKGAELAYILEHSRARLCVVHASLYASLEPVRGELRHVEHLIVVGADDVPAGCQAFDALFAAEPIKERYAPAAAGDAAVIIYTSGTTARPKGVTHTHGTLGTTARNYVAAVGMHAGDVVFGMLSMSHIFGFSAQLISPLSVGATIVIATEFDAACVFETVARLGVTHLYGLPVMWDALSRQRPEKPAGLKSLRYCLAGGDAVPRPLSERVRDVLGVELYEGCGMTEVIPYTLNRPGFANRVGSIGPPSVGIRLRLVDEHDRDVPDGEPGEILVQSDALTVGYWEDAEATVQAMRGGWFHTGDLGRRDEQGYYWFVGRKKEIIVRGGSNISPLEVEEALLAHPSVREVAVVGVPHATLGETVVAFVVLQNGDALAASDLLRFTCDRIAAYKVPERIRFLDELPRGLTGKVHRKTLKEWAARRP